MVSQSARKLRGIAAYFNSRLQRGGDSVQEYQYGNFSILLPGNHMLPIYQRKHAKYDTFLPRLATYVRSDETIIDVGANVGDTLAGMVERNSAATYVCIEPDDRFFELLTQNIARIKTARLHLRAHAIKSLVGTGSSGISLEGRGGTKHAVTGKSGKLTSKPLDEIVADLGNIPDIRVLKSDVDGFDYDVIDSSVSVIQKYKPLIFFECQYDNQSQKSGYERTLETLREEGYCDWTLLDNFGEIMVRTDDLQIIRQLFDYIWSQNVGNTTRTIYYFDVLAAQSKDRDLISNLVSGSH